MSIMLRGFSLFTIALVLMSCAPQSAATQAPTSPIPTSEELNTEQSTPSPELGGPVILTLWLPPAFDVAAGNLAANLLQDRLAAFTDLHPQVRVQVRIKSEEGTGGMLDSLLAGQSAAPLAQPDLILLPHIQMETAILSGVLLPLTPAASPAEKQDWYPFAEQMATVGDETYGIPFAADALAVAFRPTAVSTIPPNWNAYLDTRRPLGLAVADPWSQFSIAELIALHGESGNAAEFAFTQQELRDLFEFYSSAQARGVFPFWFTQYETYEQSWQAFTEGRVPMVVAWISRIFDSRNAEIMGEPLPTQNGQPFTMVKGWILAVTTPYPERTQLVTELADFLTTPEFIAQWSAAAGMLPPRASSLAAWAPDDRQALASQIITGAVALPQTSTLDLWGPALKDAMIAILKQEITQQEAVQSVLTAVANPSEPAN